MARFAPEQTPIAPDYVPPRLPFATSSIISSIAPSGTETPTKRLPSPPDQQAPRPSLQRRGHPRPSTWISCKFSRRPVRSMQVAHQIRTEASNLTGVFNTARIMQRTDGRKTKQADNVIKYLQQHPNPVPKIAHSIRSNKHAPANCTPVPPSKNTHTLTTVNTNTDWTGGTTSA